jgi:hypothetical protein
MISVTTTTNVPSYTLPEQAKNRQQRRQQGKIASLLSRCHFNQHTKQCLATKKNERLNVSSLPQWGELKAIICPDFVSWLHCHAHALKTPQLNPLALEFSFKFLHTLYLKCE